VIKYNGSAWSVDQVIAIDAEPTQGSANLVKSGGVLNSIIQNGHAFDLSAYNAQGGVLATYADLSAALTALNALPSDFKKGGMSIKFVLSSDNKYIQCRLLTEEFSINENDWEQAASVEQVLRISSAIDFTKILLPNGSQKSLIPTTSTPINGGTYKAYDYDVENINYVDIYSNILASTSPELSNAVLWALYSGTPSTENLLTYGSFLSTGEQHGECDLSLYPNKKTLRVVTDTRVATPVTEVSYLTTNYVKHSEIEDVVRTTDIVDNLESSQADKPLSAKQGKELNDKLITQETLSPTGDVKSTIPKNDGSTMSGGTYGSLVYNVQNVDSILYYQTDLGFTTNPELANCVVWALYNSTTHNASTMVAVGDLMTSDVRSGYIDMSLYPTAVSMRIACNKATAVVSVKKFIEKYATKIELTETADELREEISHASSGNKVSVLLPNKIHVVNGDRIQAFYRGFMNTFNDSIYNIKALCAEGKAYPRYFHFEATQSLVGTSKTLQVVVESPDGTVQSQKSVPILSINKPTSPQTNKNILVFGDSILGSGSVVNELKRRLTETSGTTGDRSNPKGLGLSNITFVGRKRGSAYDVPQEATGGWSWAEYATQGREAYRFTVSGVVQLHIGDVYSDGSHSYTIAEINVTDGSGNIRCLGSAAPTSASGTLSLSNGSGDATITYSAYTAENYSPFYNTETHQIDFTNYANAYCNGSIDVMIAFCGINDIFSGNIENVTTTYNSYIKPFIRKYHEQFPNGKFILSTLSLPDMNGGLGASYGAGQTANWWRGAQNYYEFARLAYELEADDEFSSYVTVANVMHLFDTENLYIYGNFPVCNRLPTIKERLGQNGVHPSGSGGSFVIGDSEAGTKTIADVLYYAACANL
jgi:hypothetical protein